jgi:cytochrome oxidase Cu insertion factor (SCO1/SenC/PrrC family)
MRARERHLTLLTAAALATAIALTGCSSSAAPSTAPGFSETANSGFDGAAIPPGEKAYPFTLTDQMGDRVSLGEYRGRTVIVAFVYSTCGRVCVLLAQQIRGALDELPKPVPVLLISAEPSADTAASVAAFLSEVSLTGRVRYLTGSAATLRPIWRAYRVTPPERDRAGFENTISLVLIDDAGEERVLFQLEELTPEALAHDARRLGAI